MQMFLHYARLEHNEIEWFDGNYTKLNQGQCHLMIPNHKSEAIWTKIGETHILERINKNYWEFS